MVHYALNASYKIHSSSESFWNHLSKHKLIFSQQTLSAEIDRISKTRFYRNKTDMVGRAKLLSPCGIQNVQHFQTFWYQGALPPSVLPPPDSSMYLPLTLGHESVAISLRTGSDVIVEMVAIDCRKEDIRVCKTPCKNKSVLSNRASSKGANNAVEKHVSRALESDRLLLRCSSVAIPVGTRGRMIHSTNNFCSTLLYFF